MTRSDVRTLAWTLRLVGLGMLAGAAALVLAGAGRASAPIAAAPTAGMHAAGTQSASLSR
jgi:hypothetical protein